MALDLHLHAQASKAVLHPVLSERCGADGALLAQHGWREHTDMSDEVDAILGQLLQDQSAQGEGGEEEGDEAAEWRQALVQRMSRLEQSFIAHQLEEESSVLPRLTTCLPEAEQRELAAAYFHGKRSARVLQLRASDERPVHASPAGDATAV